MLAILGWIALIFLVILLVSLLCGIAIGYFIDLGMGEGDPQENAIEPRGEVGPWEEYELKGHRPVPLGSMKPVEWGGVKQ